MSIGVLYKVKLLEEDVTSLRQQVNALTAQVQLLTSCLSTGQKPGVVYAQIATGTIGEQG